MSTSPTQSDVRTGRNWKAIASVLTAVYAVVLAGTIWYTSTIACSVESHDWRCMPLNEWGDALAGFFAPLAFLWLATAVMIQSQELSDQREDLKLARADARNTQLAMESQVKEAKRQAETAAQQTAILSRQFTDSQARANDEIYRELRADLLADIKRVMERHRLYTLDVGPEDHPFDESFPFEGMLRWVNRIAGAVEDGTLAKGPPSRDLERLQDRLNAMIALQEKLSIVGAERMKADMLPELFNGVDRARLRMAQKEAQAGQKFYPNGGTTRP